MTDIKIPDMNVQISDIDIKIHDTAPDHQNKNLGKLSRSLDVQSNTAPKHANLLGKTMIVIVLDLCQVVSFCGIFLYGEKTRNGFRHELIAGICDYVC